MNLHEKTVIMGCDGFVDFCAREKKPSYMLSTEYAFSVLQEAYKYGVRVFDFSFRKNILDAIKLLMRKKNDIHCYANINWKCGILLNNIDLIYFRDKIMKRIVEQEFSEKEKILLKKIPNKFFHDRFGYQRAERALSDIEIKKITLNIQEYRKRLNIVRQFAKFCLIGTDIIDWVIALKRMDIIKTMCEEVIKHKMIPIALTHWTSFTLPYLSNLPFQAFWCLLNENELLLSRERVINILDKVNKPIIPFGILRGHTKSKAEIKNAIKRAKNLPSIHSIVIGIKSKREAMATIPVAFEIINKYGHI